MKIGLFWNPIVIASVVTANKRSITEGFERTSYPTRLSQTYFDEDDALLWVAKRRAVLYIWLGCIAVLINLDGTKNNKLWMPHSKGSVLITGRRFAARCWHNGFKTVSYDWYAGFFMIETAEE